MPAVGRGSEALPLHGIPRLRHVQDGTPGSRDSPQNHSNEEFGRAPEALVQIATRPRERTVNSPLRRAMDISRGLPPSRRLGLRWPGCVHVLASGRNEPGSTFAGPLECAGGGRIAGLAGRAGQAGGTGEPDSMKSFRKEQLGKVRTKIVATVGPASSDPAILRQMVEAGVDVFRLNFSHGTHEEHTAQLRAIRQISEESGIQIAVLQDLCGPKIRLGDIPGGVVSCDHEAEFVLAEEPGPGTIRTSLTCSYPSLPGELEVGQSVLFADGTVAMEVVARLGGGARLKVTLPGLIRSHQGINVPGGALSVSPMTEKDFADLEWTAAHDVAYVGLSFVRRAEDVAALRQELESPRQPCPDRGQDREARGADQPRRDHRRGRRGDGRAGRPGRRAGRDAGAGRAEADHRRVPPGAGAGHHGHADAQ